MKAVRAMGAMWAMRAVKKKPGPVGVRVIGLCRCDQKSASSIVFTV